MSAVLKITDGTNTVNLLGGPYYLANWRPAVSQYKNAGTYIDSPLSEGRRIVYKQFSNVVERFDLKQRTSNVDSAADWSSTLFDLAERASDYWLSKAVTDPVYLEARSPGETNTRYAVVISASVPDQENPYSMPFLQSDCAVVQDNLILIVERSQWQSQPPGTTDTLEMVNIAVTDNLVSNGSFESAAGDSILPDFDSHPWWTAFNSPSTADSVLERSYTGRASAKIVGTSGSNRGIYQDIANLTSGVDYVITAKALVEDGGGSLTVYDGGGFTNAVSDDAGVRRAELITNTGFEVDLTGWGYDHMFAVSRSTTYAYAGAASARLRFDSNGVGAETPGWFYSDTFALSAGNPYFELSFAGRTITDKARVTYGLQFFDEFGTLIDYAALGHWVVLGTADWKVYQYKGWPPTNFSNPVGEEQHPAASVRAYIKFDHSLTGVHDVYVDDFSLKETIGVQNLPEHWISLAVTKTAPVSGTVRIALHSDTVIGGTLYFDDVRLDRDFAMSGSTGDKTYISNYQADDNISHILINDGGSYGGNLLDTDLPYNLLPDVPDEDATNWDSIYFGSTDLQESYSPFASLLFDIGAIAYGATDYSIVWEYRSTAASWNPLDVRDNTDSFQEQGRNSVSWMIPSDWDEDASVDSITGYWVRARIVGGMTGTLTPPAQQNFHPHVIGNPFFEIDNSEVGGDLKALVKYDIKHEGSPFMPSAKVQVTTGVDDVLFDDDGAVQSITTGGATAVLEDQTTIGVRFQNMAIPQGSRIRSAQLVITSHTGSMDSDFFVRVHGEDADDSLAWSTWANGSGRARTSAYLQQQLHGLYWNAGVGIPRSMGFVTDIVQEIVNRTGWTSGNAMSFFITDYDIPGSSYRTFRMYETQTNAFAIIVEWEQSDAYTTTIIMGARKTERGADFRSHLNMMAGQPEAVTLSLGQSTSFSENIHTLGVIAPRNQIVKISGFDLEAGDYLDRAIFRIHAPMSQSYGGRFRAFVRVFHTDTPLTVSSRFRLKVTAGAGGVSYSGDTALALLNVPEIVDLGLVAVPEVGATDYIELAVQVLRSDSTAVYMCDLVLIPVDEWAIELSSMANNPYGMLDGDTLLEVDGITPAIGAAFMSALLRKISDSSVRARFIVSGGRPVLDNRVTQRMYCLAGTDTGIGSGSGEIENASLSNGVLSVQASKLLRYLGLRGAS